MPDPTAANDHYILVARDDRFWIVGPFPTNRAAAVWGHKRKNNPGDDPRWQTIRLAKPTARVRVVDPAAGPMEAV